MTNNLTLTFVHLRSCGHHLFCFVVFPRKQRFQHFWARVCEVANVTTDRESYAVQWKIRGPFANADSHQTFVKDRVFSTDSNFVICVLFSQERVKNMDLFLDTGWDGRCLVAEVSFCWQVIKLMRPASWECLSRISLTGDGVDLCFIGYFNFFRFLPMLL